MEQQTACNAQETSTVTVQQSAKNTQSASKLYTTLLSQNVHSASLVIPSQMEHAMPVQEQAMAQMAHIASQSTTALKESLDNPLLHAQSVRVDMAHQTACNAQEPNIVMAKQGAKLWQLISV